MKKIIIILVAITLALVLGLGAEVSSLQLSMIPSDALWVLHLDVEKYAVSQLCKVLSDEGDAGIHHQAGQALEKFRIDPLKDLKSITIFGRGEANEEPVVAISGNFDKAYLLGLLKTASSQKEIPYGKHTIYSWENNEFGVFATDNLIFFSEKQDNIQAALDALDGKIKDISSSPLLARIKKESPEAIVTAAAADISGITGEREKPGILSKMRTAACSIAEKGEAISLKLDIAAESAQVAKELEQAVRGLIAIANLQLAETKEVEDILKNINIALDGEKVRIDLNYPTAKLVDLLKKHEAMPHAALKKFAALPGF
jgi:hypothetical protein